MLALLLFAPSFASAAEWDSYSNPRFGYSIAVPPGFIRGPEAETGAGRAFRKDASRLAVWGAVIEEADFEAAARQAASDARAEGWTITDEAETPTWASLAGSMGQRLFVMRLIPLCSGRQIAGFNLVYSAIDAPAIEKVRDRVSRSFKPTGAGEAC